MTLRAVFFLPAFFFIVSQIVSICGAFEVLSSLHSGGMEDLSLEEIVFVDPFLRSIERTSVHHLVPQRAVAQAVRVILKACLNHQPAAIEHDRAYYVAQIEVPRVPNIWLSNRVLRI